jgi:hypothetical protein
MRHTNRKLVLGLFVAALSLCLGLVSPHRTYAAGLSGGTGLIDPGGNTIQLSNAKFTDPFTITIGSVTYHSKMTACDGDHIYNCGDGDVFHTGNYWFWPTSDGSPSTSQISGGKCASAIVLAIRQTPNGTGMNGSYIYAVQAKAGLNTTGNNGGCMVPDDSGNAIKAQDITGWGARPEWDTDVTKNTVDTIVNPKNVGRITVNKGMGFALGTEFKWVNKNEIDNIMGGGSGPSLRKSMLVTNADTVKTIQAALAHDDSSTKSLASGYNYFIPSDCIDGKQQIVALLAVSTSDPSQATIVHRMDGNSSKGYRADSWQGDQQSCLIGKNHWNSPNRVWGGGRSDPVISLADVQNATSDGSSTGTSGGGTDASTSTDDTQLDCDTGVPILNWIVCPLIQIAQGTATKLDGIVAGMLQTPIDQTFNDNYKQAWNSFRILGTALIVIAGLVMVVSQALGFEILDAYTIRKTLPRLLVAIIGMSLSWPIMQFIVSFFNTLSNDIYGLIVGPFSGVNATITASGATLTTMLVALGAVGGWFIFGPAALLMILSAILGLLLAFLFLLIRQIGIAAIVILAPFAIAAYVLPNTQKIYKVWSDNFMGLMLVGPIIMAMIAAGHGFAVVSIASKSTVGQIVGIVAYFLPYFFFPVAFRMATGIFSTLTGMVNDRSKGVFDRMKNVRGNAAKTRHTMRMNDGMSHGRIGSAYRRLGAVSTPGSGALMPTRNGKAAYNAYRRAHLQAVTAEALKNDGGRAAGDDDATALAVQRHMSRSKFVEQYQARTGKSADEAANALALLERGFGAQMGTDAMRVAAFRARAGSSTAYSGDAEGTAQRFNEGAALITDGLMTSADATAAGKGNRARTDINGSGFGTQITTFDNAVRNGGMSVAQAQDYLDNTLQEADPGDILAGNTRTITALAPSMMRNLNRQLAAATTTNADGSTSVDLDHVGLNRALGQIAGIQDNLNRTSPQKAGMFADLVNGIGMVHGGERGEAVTVRQMVETASTRQANEHGGQSFLEVRKEYGSRGRPLSPEEQAAANYVPPAPEEG